MVEKKENKKTNKNNKPTHKNSNNSSKTNIKVNAEDSIESASVIKNKQSLKFLYWLFFILLFSVIMISGYIWYEVNYNNEKSVNPNLSPELKNLLSEAEKIEKQLKKADISNPAVEKAISEISRFRFKLQESQETFLNINSAYSETQNAVASLIRKVNEIEETMVTQNQMDDLIKRIAAIETDKNYFQDGSLVLMATLMQLKEAFMQGNTFNDELEALETVGKKQVQVTKLIEKIKPYKNAGIPTYNMLSNQFDSLSTEIIKKSIDPKEETIGSRLTSGLRKLVTIKKIKADEDDVSLTGFLARTQNKLSVKDYSGAIEIMRDMKEKYPKLYQIADVWVSKVMIRIETEKMFSDIVSNILGQINKE